MTPQGFAKEFYLLKMSLLETCFNTNKPNKVSTIIEALDLDKQGIEQVRQIIDAVLVDAFYTVLLGIDGAAQIGDKQLFYKLLNEQGKELTGGEIEANAWEYFHNCKFEKDRGTADFIAELEYRLEGGRTSPAMSGYRPHIKFPFDEMQTSGQQRFIDRSLVFPGDRVKAEINIIAVDRFAFKLEEGMTFEFNEGSRRIGTGKILAIVNEKLNKNAK